MRIILYLLLLVFLFACQPSTTALPIPGSTSTAKPSSATSVPPTSSAQTPSLPASPLPPTEPIPETQIPTEALPLSITVVYNNIEYDPRLETAWGFAALVERGDQSLLFDTGGDGNILLRNMATLGIDPERIQGVVLSHIHGDHVGGLNELLNVGLDSTIYIPPSFPASFKNSVKQAAPLLEVEPGLFIMDGILSTGELGKSIPEQALIIRTTRGMVIITGCAHPGVVQMVEQAIRLTDEPVYLVMGGFHLGQTSRSRITGIVESFKEMGVEKVAPSHCTGNQAIEMFREAYGDAFIDAGAGCVILIET